MTAFDETERSTKDAAASAVSRRTLVKGAAWSVPIVAATVAVPAHAASPDACAGNAVNRANKYLGARRFVTLPACARRVDYIVAGGGGGGGIGHSRGSMITGSLSVQGGERFDLVAGAGGLIRGQLALQRATGYNDGGMGTTYWDTETQQTLAAGGGGGASSALVLLAPIGSGLSNIPLIVAGGGGGSGWATAWSVNGDDAGWLGGRAGVGADGEPTQSVAGDASMNAEKNPPGPMVVPLTEFGYHGESASSTAAGQGGLVSLSGQGAGWPQPAGLPGGNGSSTNGWGGDAPASNSKSNPTAKANARFGGAGGGGGGWFGGGAGATLWMENQSGVGGGAGGGAGSNYYGGTVKGGPAVSVRTVSLPFPTDVTLSDVSLSEEGYRPGYVYIAWS
ncbi:hypothetical protein [Microbacterium sp.]|uniref:hypothetical protein n=1 Tax=Microbacterium sp. TaxID=51671 RepID=UPI00333EA7B9